MRWHDYVLERGDGLAQLWVDHFAPGESQPLFVMAKSFDPRSCTALEQLLETGALENVDIRMLHYNSGDEKMVDADLVSRASNNLSKIEQLVASIGTIEAVELRTDSEGQRRNTSGSAKDVFRAYSDIESYSDIIVDISGMPRSVFFPLIARLLALIDASPDGDTGTKNLFVVVSEDPNVDTAIKHEGVDPFAEFLPFFRGTSERGSGIDLPTVWLPILGENRIAQLEFIENEFNSKNLEIWPILPSPSRDPRRGDNLFIEYQKYLLDNHRIDPRSFIYASEDNPFEVYRQLYRATEECRNTLKPLGGPEGAGCHVVYSALSSKLMSLGTLLAAYDLKTRETNKIDVGIAHVGCNNYRLEECEPDTEVFGLWLTGRCYDVD
jgi:hypothetical protein